MGKELKNPGISFLRVCCCVFLAATLLSACLPETKKSEFQQKVKILEGEIGGGKYYVPEPYFVIPGLAFSDGTIYIHALYPDFVPLQEDTQAIWKKGQGYRYIHVLVKYWPNLPSPDVLIKKNIEALRATERVAEEYGLVHMRQSKDYNQDEYDVWLKSDSTGYLSYITCGEKLGNTDTPQCSDHMYQDKFAIEIHFDKRLLPEWPKIRQSFLYLFDSFQSESRAKNFYNQKIFLTKIETSQIGRGE